MRDLRISIDLLMNGRLAALGAGSVSLCCDEGGVAVLRVRVRSLPLPGDVLCDWMCVGETPCERRKERPPLWLWRGKT